ncbi:nuclear transport factor 2 family protein [Pseudomonas sp. MWU13-3659]|uniref:nuclear transport factor 2 family protein n=1 Tax=Pseudomonas sp. MWU13-3659 TaxID=2986964 RepID=UPI0020759227|nr:nuclear transport factor 2 family protein [Pseudomonas sp. MWU13-3659]
MSDNTLARAAHSVHHVHVLIQEVFTRPAAETQATLEALMAVFADDFSMVGTAGSVFDRQQVEQLFHRVAGARPGLEIVVGDVRVVWQAGNNVAVRYKETHRLLGVEQARWSLAIIECSDQAVTWHCLHETAIPH